MYFKSILEEKIESPFQRETVCVAKAKTEQIPLSISTTIHADATVQKTIPITKQETRATWLFILIPVKRGYL